VKEKRSRAFLSLLMLLRPILIIPLGVKREIMIACDDAADKAKQRVSMRFPSKS